MKEEMKFMGLIESFMFNARIFNSITRLSGTALCKNGVSFSGDKVSASASIRFLIPVWGSREYTGTAGWTFTCKEKAVISNEEELLRKQTAKK